jgi:hypothetical protein
VESRADLFREFTRPRRLRIGNRDEPDRRMLRGKARAQRADTARSDDGEPQILAFDDGSSLAPF